MLERYYYNPEGMREQCEDERVDGVAEDLTAAGVVEEDLFLLQGGEVGSDGVEM